MLDDRTREEDSNGHRMLDTGEATGVDEEEDVAVAQEAGISKYFGFVASHELAKIVGLKGVLVLGLSRAGKSSVILVQRGSSMRSSGPTRTLVANHNDGDPVVSESLTSRTINIGMYEDKRRRRIYFDSAGIDENRGRFRELWTRFNLETSLSLIEELQATVVVMNWQTTFATGGNALTLRTLADKAREIAGEGPAVESFYDTMCFVLTFVGNGSVKVDDVLARIAQAYLNELEEYHRALVALRTNFPKPYLENVRTRAAAQIRNLYGTDFVPDGVPKSHKEKIRKLKAKIDKVRSLVNFEAVYDAAEHDNERAQFDRANSSVRLLETILADRRRVILSHPVSRTACGNQRDELENAIRARPPMKRSELLSLVRNRTLNYEIYGLFARVARELKHRLDDYNTSVTRLFKVVEDHSDSIQSIRNDWEGYRDQRASDYVKQSQDLDEERTKNRAEITRLKTSTNLVCPAGYQYFCNKSFEAPWYHFGLGQMVVVLEHDEPYVEYETDDPRDPGVSLSRVVVVERCQKFIKLKLIGKWQTSLATPVKFLICEKDSPETPAKIETLEKKNRHLERDIERLRTAVRVLRTGIAGVEDLIHEEVTKTKKDDIEALRTSTEELYREVNTTLFASDDSPEPIKVPYVNAAAGLASLLEILQDRGASPRDFFAEKPDIQQDLVDFGRSYATKLGLDDRKKRSAAFEALVSGLEGVNTARPLPSESCDRFSAPPGPLNLVVERTKQFAIESTNFATRFSAENPLAVSSALAGLLFLRGLNFNYTLCLAVFVFLFGSLLALARLLDRTLALLKTERREFKDLISSVSHDLRAAVGRGGDAMESAVRSTATSIDAFLDGRDDDDDDNLSFWLKHATRFGIPIVRFFLRA